MKPQLTSRPGPATRAFTLVEMAAVMMVTALLLGVGIHALGDTAAQARQTATANLIGVLEQARATAITSRSVVALALAEPGDAPGGDSRCRVGLFKIREWPADPATLDGILVGRWQALPDGVILLPGSLNGLRNPRDEPPVTLRYLAANQPVTGSFHLLAFSPRGALLWPAGADPLVLRIAEGARRTGQAAPNTRSRSGGGAENRLHIGRLTARPYQFDR